MSGNGPTWAGHGAHQDPSAGPAVPPPPPLPLPPVPPPPGVAAEPAPLWPSRDGSGAGSASGGGFAPHAPQPTPHGPLPTPHAAPHAAHGFAPPMPQQPMPQGSAPRSSRRGLPAWAWWTIGVGAVVVAGAVIAVSLVINLTLPFVAGTGTDGGTASGPSDVDDAGTGPDRLPEGDGYPLEAAVDADLANLWRVPVLGTGWAVDEEDEAYVFATHTGGCTFEAQSMPLVGHDPAAADDATASDADFSAYLDEIAEGTEIVGQTFEEADGILLGSASGSIEFAVYDARLIWNDGTETVERWYWRSFIEASTSMYGFLSCPAGELTPTQVDETIGALTVE